MFTRDDIDRIDAAATRWADWKMARCPICKADISDGHKHTAQEAKRYLKKANQRGPIPGKNYPRRDKILGGQNFRRSIKERGA